MIAAADGYVSSRRLREAPECRPLLNLRIDITLFNSKSVTALIFRMSGMALYPVEGDLVLFEQREERLPEVNIEGRLFV